MTLQPHYGHQNVTTHKQKNTKNMYIRIPLPRTSYFRKQLAIKQHLSC